MDGEGTLIERLRNGDDLHSRIEAAAEIERLRAVLMNIVDAYDARSELFIADAWCVANLADRALAGLRIPRPGPEPAG